MKKILLVTLLFAFYTTARAQQGWVEVGGSNGGVYPADSIGSVSVVATDVFGNVYAGGYLSFTDFNNYIVKWTGSGWSEVGTGSNVLNANGAVNSIATDGAGNVYVAGQFYVPGPNGGVAYYGSTNDPDTAGYYYVAKWDGTKWSELVGKTGVGDSLKANAQIFALAVDYKGDVYAGGQFTDENGNFYVAHWNGTSWGELNTGIVTAGLLNYSTCQNAFINAITTDSKGNVYAAIGNSITRWSQADSAWNSIGGDTAGLGANANINAIAADSSGNVYVGGCFTNGTYNYVAKWNGTSWSALKATGTDSIGYSTGTIQSIVADKSGNIYAAGAFLDGYFNASSEYVIYGYVAQWSGTSWSQVGIKYDTLSKGGVNAAIDLAVDGSGNVYAVAGTTDANGDYFIAEYGPGTTATSVTAAANSPAVNVYPNPTNGSFTISAPEAGQVTVYNSLGQAVASQNAPVGFTTITLDNVPTGVYTVILAGQTGAYPAVKLVKN